jgi:hypothetical protein
MSREMCLAHAEGDVTIADLKTGLSASGKIQGAHRDFGEKAQSGGVSKPGNMAYPLCIHWN